MDKEKVHTESDQTYNPMDRPTAPRPKVKPTKKKKIKRRGGGDFNIEMKIPKDMVNKGVMYGYKSGGQV
mgnify:CR=1 FL=1